MSEDSFENARKALRWAEGHIADFQQTEAAFLHDQPCRVVVEPGLNLGIWSSVFARDIKQPPEALEKAAYYAVGDLRNALDFACHSACVMLGTGDKNRTNFPFADTEKDFERRLAAPKGIYRGIPAELHPKLASFEPFWTKKEGGEGNTTLAFLNRIANPNKHQVPLRSTVLTGGIGINELFGIDITFDIKRKSKSEVEILRLKPTSQNFSFKAHVETVVVMCADERRFGKQKASELLTQIFGVVKNIVDEIEIETIALTGGS